ncbi:hypothetical protein [Nocardia abscessus]|uniref:hypothetical protein n=1 Tax=Nocardia abscessus TaxID=120957 RepID=UPI001E63281C|nr:hypothetical protein [Nocardia abscessus]
MRGGHSPGDQCALGRRTGRTAGAALRHPVLHFVNTDQYASRTLSRKTAAADALVHTVRLAIETVGGLGYSRTCELEMRYRDVHGCLFHPLPRAEQTHFTGRVLLGSRRSDDTCPIR